jgi:pimeloyl-ACP methyl ester carboxylesterase
VVGNSIGRWIAAEMAIIGSPRVSRYVIVDAVGLQVSGHAVVDFFSLTPAQVAQRRYRDPERYGIDPSTLAPEAQESMASNRQTLAVYGGQTMTDPGAGRPFGHDPNPHSRCLGRVRPYRRSRLRTGYANAIPGAEYALLTETGHMPQIETPEKLIDTVWAFAHRHAAQ